MTKGDHPGFQCSHQQHADHSRGPVFRCHDDFCSKFSWLTVPSGILGHT